MKKVIDKMFEDTDPNLGFGIRTHALVASRYYIVRHGQPYTHPKHTTKQLTMRATQSVILELIKEEKAKCLAGSSQVQQ